jgi:hypothetical protein
MEILNNKLFRRTDTMIEGIDHPDYFMMYLGKQEE